MPTMTVPSGSSLNVLEAFAVIGLAIDTPIDAGNTTTSFTGTIDVGGAPATATFAGVGFTYGSDEFGTFLSGGTVQSLTVTLGGQTLVAFTNLNWDVATLAPVIDADLNGSDPTALETYLLSLDWTLNLGVANDIITPTTDVGDGVNFVPTGAVTAYGNNGDDQLSGGLLADSLYGGSGADVLHSSVGADLMDGGANADSADYTTSNAAVSISLGAGGSASGGHAAGDTLVGIEGLVGSAFDDVLTGNVGTNIFYGGDGSDVLNGSSGNDELYGSDGDDLLLGGNGADTLAGGVGVDTASYVNAGGRVVVDLAGGTAGGVGQNGGDTLTSIENVIGSTGNDFIVGDGNANSLNGYLGDDRLFGLDGDDFLNGSQGNDMLYGGFGADYLVGGNGNDVIDGSSGNDTINGGNGDDTMSGGSGADVFIFAQTESGADVISDFEDGVDVMDFSASSFIYSDLVITSDGTDTTVAITDGFGITLGTITLIGVGSGIDSGDFSFV